MDIARHAAFLVSRRSAALVLCGGPADAGTVARGLVSLLGGAARLFEVVGDDLTDEQAAAFSAALAGPEPVILFGRTESDLMARLAHVWPDYVENARHTATTITRKLSLKPVAHPEALPAVFIVTAEAGGRFDSDRPVFWYLSAEEAAALAAAGDRTPLTATVLGLHQGREVSMRALCLMHQWDAEGVVPRSMSKILVERDTALNWTDISTLLRPSPNLEMLEFFRRQGRISDDQYGYAGAAARFLRDWNDRHPGPIFPDVYSAVWSMEPVIENALFRGQYSAAWGLQSTLMRPGPNGLDIDELQDRLARTREFTDILRQRSNELFACTLSDDELLAVAQHFGFPTPLLDYTRSVRVAAFFATAHPPPQGADGIGVIYFMRHTPEQSFAATSTLSALPPLTELCGVRLGSLKVIEPQLPNDDNRIGRQQGVFVAGYNPRAAAAVTIDRIYFRQQPGIMFEDPRAGVTRLHLMPEDAPVSKLSDEFKKAWQRRPGAGPILGSVRLDESSILGSSVPELYWQLREGQKLLGEVLERARQADPPSAERLGGIVREYFNGARIQADVTRAPHAVEEGAALDPLYDAVAALETLAGLSAGAIWSRIQAHVRSRTGRGFLDVEPAPEWPLNAQLALGCALFLGGWEHLRKVDCGRARDLVQTAQVRIATAGERAGPAGQA